jgi:hypothetical protein
MSSAQHEHTVRAFLQPLRTVPAVQRQLTSARPRPGGQLVRLGAIAVAGFALVALIALIAHRSPTPEQPATPARFARIGGWIAVGGNLTAFDPSHPNRFKLLSRLRGEPLAWSADRTKLLVAGRSGLYVIRGDGTTTRVAPAGVAGGSFTPDGGQVIYESGGTIYQVSSDGRTRTTIASRSHKPNSGFLFPYFTGGQLSPDGTTIVYNRLDGPQLVRTGIWLMNSDGSHRRQIVSYRAVVAMTGYHDLNDISALTWFPDSNRLLLIALDQSTDHCAMFTVNRDGSELRRFGPRGFCAMRAAASPDRHHMAFTGTNHMQVTITDLHGLHSGVVQLPRGTGGSLSLAWAPE